MSRLTDQAAIKIALFIAIDSELALIDGYRDVDGKIMEGEHGVQLARRNIAAFERILDRRYGGARPRKLPSGKSVSVLNLMNESDRKFDPQVT